MEEGEDDACCLSSVADITHDDGVVDLIAIIKCLVADPFLHLVFLLVIF